MKVSLCGVFRVLAFPQPGGNARHLEWISAPPEAEFLPMMCAVILRKASPARTETHHPEQDSL